MRPSFSAPKYTSHRPSPTSSRPTYSPARVWLTQTQRLFQRIPLLRLTSRRSMCPGLLIQGFVRTLVVVLVTKPIEADLLRLKIPAGRTRGLRLQLTWPR